MRIINYAYIICLLSSICYASNPPIISIITSVYDGDKFIKGFMADIVRQTIFNQCELIIINADSPGKKETKIIQKYMEKYPNIIYKKLSKDPGLYAVWNMAIDMAKADIITNANIDDRLSPQCYEKHYNALQKNPNVDLVYSDKYITDKANTTFEAPEAKFITSFPDFSIENMILCLPNNHPMWRKSLHKRAGKFNVKYKSAGDYEMWLRAVAAGSKFLKVPEILAVYYLNPFGLSSGKIHEKAMHEKKKIFDAYKKLLRLDMHSAYDVIEIHGAAWNSVYFPMRSRFDEISSRMMKLLLQKHSLIGLP